MGHFFSCLCLLLVEISDALRSVREPPISTDKIITTKTDDPENNEELRTAMEKIKSETQFDRVVLEEFTPNGLQRRINSLFQQSFC